MISATKNTLEIFQMIWSVLLTRLTLSLRRYALLLIAENLAQLTECHPLPWGDLYALVEAIKLVAVMYATQYEEADPRDSER